MLAVSAWVATCAPPARAADLAQEARANRVQLPNGWSISPLGEHFAVGDLVLNILPAPDGRHLVALNSGYQEHALTVFDPDGAEVVQRIPLVSSWLGMAWSPDGRTLYVSGGNDRRGDSAPLHVFGWHDEGPQHLVRRASPVFRETFARPAAEAGEDLSDLPVESDVQLTGENVFWSGLAHHPREPLLFAANRTGGYLVVFDTRTGAVADRIRTGVNPYDLVFSRDGATLFVSNWASDSISVIDVEARKVRRTIAVGDSPNDLALGRDGRLYVACANDNSVHVIDTHSERDVGRFVTSLWPGDPAGSTPNALLLDEERGMLYVANADNNTVAVIATGERDDDESDADDDEGEEEDDDAAVLGFLPTAAYPSALALTRDGTRLVVGASKGDASTANLRGPHVGADGGGRVPADEGTAGTIKTLLESSVHVFPLPESGAELRALTEVAYENTPYHRDLLVAAAPPQAASIVPRNVGEGSPIRHVLYIIKENRTYDQILGDVEKGRGDPRIAIFGREVTPNHHALAEEWALLDNYYVDAEVSIDGHSWSAAAYATDFNEKTWPADYGGRTGRPPFTAAAEPPAGYLWDLAREAGLTYRSYGERTTHPSLAGHASTSFKGWDAPLDVENAYAFLGELEEYDRQYRSADPAKRLPNLMVMSLPHDHTYGGRPGAPTPTASVAANDLALGMIVERLTRSPYWRETAIFVTEDDAQDGSDHVDCHRSILLVISPYTRRGIVDSTHYTTSSILRTIELLLGLPPMSQYDAAATPLYATLGTEADLAPYRLRQVDVDLNATNPPNGYGAQASLAMDWSDFDRTPMQELNEIVWKLVRGEDSEMPLPVRRYDWSGLYAAGAQ